MSGEKVKFDAAAAKNRDNSRENERSTIAFPYYDLESAAEVARAAYKRSGLSPCPLDELAAQQGVTMSGNFRLKNSAARIFGFIGKDTASSVTLTDLGARLVSAESEAEARAAAFLTVPLYSQIFEKYRGKLLPPTKALEREMITLGVAPKQAAKARQVFQSSAKFAGFFNSGEDRLVRPRVAGTPVTAELGEAPETLRLDRQESPDLDSGCGNNRRGNSGGGGDGYHPFVQGLLQTMPEPNTVWTIDGRAAWLEAAANIFKLIYQGDGKITIKAESDKSNGAAS